MSARAAVPRETSAVSSPETPIAIGIRLGMRYGNTALPTVLELQRELGVSRATAYRHLHALREARGFTKPARAPSHPARAATQLPRVAVNQPAPVWRDGPPLNREERIAAAALARGSRDPFATLSRAERDAAGAMGLLR